MPCFFYLCPLRSWLIFFSNTQESCSSFLKERKKNSTKEREESPSPREKKTRPEQLAFDNWQDLWLWDTRPKKLVYYRQSDKEHQQKLSKNQTTISDPAKNYKFGYHEIPLAHPRSNPKVHWQVAATCCLQDQLIRKRKTSSFAWNVQ